MNNYPKKPFLTYLFKTTLFLLYKHKYLRCLMMTHSKNLPRFGDVHSVASISQLSTQLPPAARYRN